MKTEEKSQEDISTGTSEKFPTEEDIKKKYNLDFFLNRVSSEE